MLVIIEAANPSLAASLSWFRFARLTRMVRLISINMRLREWVRVGSPI